MICLNIQTYRKNASTQCSQTHNEQHQHCVYNFKNVDSFNFSGFHLLQTMLHNDHTVLYEQCLVLKCQWCLWRNLNSITSTPEQKSRDTAASHCSTSDQELCTLWLLSGTKSRFCASTFVILQKFPCSLAEAVEQKFLCVLGRDKTFIF